jgi:hypothetical protein
MRNVGVNVLGTPSRKDSLVVTLKDLREALKGATLSAEQVGDVAWCDCDRLVRVGPTQGPAQQGRQG